MPVYREQSHHVLAADADVDAENMENEMEKEGGSVDAQQQPLIKLDLEREMTTEEMNELSGNLSIVVFERVIIVSEKIFILNVYMLLNVNCYVYCFLVLRKKLIIIMRNRRQIIIALELFNKDYDICPKLAKWNKRSSSSFNVIIVIEGRK